MTQKKHTLKTYLLTGILVTAPVALTLWLAWKIAIYFDSLVIDLLPQRFNPTTYLPQGLPGLGIILLLVFLVMVGWLTTGYFGRMTSRIWQKFLARIPVLPGIYSAFRKIFETILGSGKGTAFRQAVLIEYPRKGLWTVAFVSGPVYQGIQSQVDNPLLAVFVPTTPNPTSGFLIYVPKKDVKPLNISVEEALKMVISTGIVNPDSKKSKKRSS